MNLENIFDEIRYQQNNRVPNVGLVIPNGFLRHKHHGRGAEEAETEIEVILYVV